MNRANWRRRRCKTPWLAPPICWATENPAAIAVLTAPQGTNEDCYLLARLTAEVLPGCRVIVTAGEPGDEDEFSAARRQEIPIPRGAPGTWACRRPRPPDDLAQLAAAIDAGRR